MFVYIGVTLFSVFLMYGVKNYQIQKISYKNIDTIYENRYEKKWLFVIPFIPLYLLSALRYGIGTDYFHTYYPTFQKILSGSQTDNGFEYGFYYINKFVAVYSSDVTWVLAICALFFFVFVGISIYQQSDDPVFSIALLFGTGLFQYSLNGVRQAIVIAIWFYCLRYIEEKRFVPFLIFVITSTLFHYSALILIPLYFLFQKRFKPSHIIVVVVGAFAFTTVLKKFILYIAGFTRYINKFSGSSLLDGDFAWSEFIISVLLLVYLLVLYKKLKCSWKYNFLLLSTALGVVCSILTREIYIIARVSLFFRYLPVLYLPSTLKVFKRESKIIVKWGFIALFFAYMWYMTGYLGKGDSVPYQSVFDR